MRLRALIVEDCPSMRHLLMQALPLTELAEFQFVEAVDGMDALAKFNSSKTDILFVDWNMPRLTGIDFARRVRASRKGRRIPIVMVTGIGTLGSMEEALDKVGADAYVTKPYTVDTLRRRLAKLIARIEAEQSERSAPTPARLLSKLIHPSHS